MCDLKHSDQIATNREVNLVTALQRRESALPWIEWIPE
jgi:hypothetical protein